MKRVYFHLLFYLFVIVICLLDIYTGSKFSLKAVLFIPFYIYITHFSSSLKTSVLFAIFMSVAWSVIDYNYGVNDNSFLLLLNWVIRFISLSFLAFLLFNYKTQRRQLKEINEKLKVAIKEKNELMGIASHDLRNPITSIYSFTELILNNGHTDLNQKQLKYIQNIQRISGKMNILLKETLDYTKIESGTLKLNILPYEYLTTIREVLDEIIDFANQKKIAVTIDCPENKILLNLDRQRMEQVITNLLSNAIKYSRSNTTIVIRVRKLKEHVKTEIIDQGVGIRNSEIEKIFNPFVKTSSKPTAGEASHGLGLTIVKKFIEAHGGTVSVESRLNIGSNFSFILPS